MTCDEAEILLHALIDGELDAGHAREVEAHIATCPGCAARLAAYRQMSRQIADADLRFTAPAGLRLRIEAALPQPRAQAPSRRAVLRGFAMGSAASAIAASGLVAIVLRSDDEARIKSEIVSAHLRSLQAGHLTDVLSDDKIVELLVADGIDIARRTVAKYREAMRIPSSVQRRRDKMIRL